ncbi:MAG: metallophosphoesterase [Saccharofermentans sp.]|nr:metallophosphoesterase [Saccharofermentans sp.]
MYRILVCSDIHRNIENFKYALEEAYGEGVDEVLIAGDIEVDPAVIEELVEDAGATLRIVKGNCDYGLDLKDMLTFELPGGVNCLLTHGHRYYVKSDLYTLAEVANNMKANLVIYGHTHIYDDTFMGKVHFVNPGALCGGYFSPASYVLMTIDGGRVDVIKRVIR